MIFFSCGLSFSKHLLLRYLFALVDYIVWSKKSFRSCDGNSGFSHDLIFVEVSEWDDIVWFIIFSVCKRFGS